MFTKIIIKRISIVLIPTDLNNHKKEKIKKEDKKIKTFNIIHKDKCSKSFIKNQE